MLKMRFILAVLLLAIVLGLGLVIGVVVSRGVIRSNPPRVYNPAVLLKQVQGLSQLVTVRYVMEQIVTVEDVKWFGENRVLLVAHGVVKAGVDLLKLKPSDFDLAQKRITIHLPAATIVDVYLDDERTEVIERTTGILRQFDKDLEQNARRKARDELQMAARASGIIRDANERARLQLIQLFHQLGFEEVEILLPAR